MNLNNLYPRSIGLAAIIIAFAVGCIAAKMYSFVQFDHTENKSISSDYDLRNSYPHFKPVIGESWKITKEILTKDWRTSPSVSSDYPMLERSRSTLSKVSIEDQIAWFHELRSNYNYRDHDTTREFMKFIFTEIGQRNPEILIKYLTDHPNEEFKNEYKHEYKIEKVIFNWIENDPISAIAWLDKKESAEFLEGDDINYLIKEAITKLAVTNPSEFEARLKVLDQEMRESILSAFAYNTGTPQGRLKLLERAAISEHNEALALWTGLLSRVNESNTEEAYTILNQLEISDADRLKLDLAILEQNLPNHYFSNLSALHQKNSEVTLAWLEKHPQHPTPEVILRSFGDWCSGDLEKVSDWIIHKLPESRYDDFATIAVETTMNEDSEKFITVAKIASQIKDPLKRAQSQRLIKKSWQKKDSAAATEWEKNLPVSDQEKLK